MQELKDLHLSSEIYTKGDIDQITTCNKYIDQTSDIAINFGISNEISGETKHETMTIGIENSAYDGGIAIGYWCKAEGEDCLALGCEALAKGTGWANNAAIGHHAAVTGKNSVQLLMKPGTAEDRAAGRDYGILSSDNTFRFRNTVIVGSNGKIPAESIDIQSLINTVKAQVLADLQKTAGQ